MKTLHLTVTTCGLLLASLAGHPARADVLNMGGVRDPLTGHWTGFASLETVPVGNAGNAPDTRYATPGYGSVGYNYRIGRYEVTAGQYTEFLNAVAGVDTYGLYTTSMWVSGNGCKIERWAGNGTSESPYQYRVAGDYANRPVHYVSFWDACRFANWLHNGQPTGAQGAGTTETGAYTLGGYNGQDGRTIHRNADWKWAVTSEDEWYKAAYHKNDGVTGNYWDYATCKNSMPGRDLGDVSGNNANYYGIPYPIQSPYYTTMAGEFQTSDSPYGTFDQCGNVWEWNEAIAHEDATSASRGERGGDFETYTFVWLRAPGRSYSRPTAKYSRRGFRMAQAPAPGDVNGDSHVDVVDLLYLVDAFGSMAGDANYDARCDFNHDGTVDVVDLLDLVYSFGN